MYRKAAILVAVLVLFGTAPAPAQEAGPLLPQSQALWISDNPDDLFPILNTIWEFTTYDEGPEPVTQTVIFTDHIDINSKGTALLGTMLPPCTPLQGPTGPIYQVCGWTMYVMFSEAQLKLFDHMTDYGYCAVLVRPEISGFTYFWFNTYLDPEYNSLEAGLAVGFAEHLLPGMHLPPVRLEGRRVGFVSDDMDTR
jgi:hypothetical protein